MGKQMQKIWLMAHDFNEHGTFVVQSAAAELAALKGSMVLLHVYHVPPPPSTVGMIGNEMTYLSTEELTTELRKRALSELEKVAADLRSLFPGLPVETQAREGDPVDEILTCAKEHGVERIVVGTHGRKGVERFFLGSVAERVVRMAQCSVLVVKRHEETQSSI